MTKYTYLATDKKGNSLTGTVEARDRTGAIASLSKQGIQPISIKEPTTQFKFLKQFGGKGRIKSDQMVMFTRQLSAMISAGVPLARALSSLADHTDSPALRTVCAGLVKDVQSGTSFSEALEKYPTSFDTIFVNMVKAGEEAGILDSILKRLALQQEKSGSMRKKIKSAMAYPVVLMIITVIAFFGMMIFIIPQIGSIVTNLGGPNAKLPGLTLAMLAISHAIITYWYIIFPVLFGGTYLLIRYLKTDKGRRVFQRLILKIPKIKTVIIKVAISRFTRTFSALMGAGVSVLDSLEVTSRAVGNVVYEDALIKASEQVRNGKQLSSVLEENPLFPSIVTQMLIVGEETGQTDQVLVKVADFYDEEVDAAISGLSAIIEPVMIVIMGTVVGLIAASVMMPIAGMANQIQ